MVTVARDCVKAACGYASRWKTVGEIWVFARAWAINNRMELAGESAVGHRILPKEGMVASGFPRSAHLATHIPGNRIHRLHPIRMRGMFAIRPAIQDAAGWSAAFEEVVWIQDEQRKILGRDSADEIGTF